MSDSLKRYREKRNFDITPEPAEGGQSVGEGLAFVIQKHWASRLHYDFRLELDGAMKSWAVPKGPSYDPKVKRMALQVEDHPIAYNAFEGSIPKGQYGAGKVIIWDEGSWTPIGDPRKGYREGHLKFTLDGKKMHGQWALVRMKGKASEKQPPWLLIKDRDDYAQDADAFSVVDEMPDSVVPLREDKTQARSSAMHRSKPAASSGTSPTKKPSRRQVTGDDTEGSRTGNTPLPGKAAALPRHMKPQLATLVNGMPRDADRWIYEVKFDGYRILARIEGKQAKLFTRNGHDWSAKLPHLVRELRALPVDSAWLDGEIVVLSREGVPSFQALQNAFDAARTQDIIFYVFDLPYISGRDISSEPLTQRRHWLRQLVGMSTGNHVRFSEAYEQPVSELVKSACKLGLEGFIGKRPSAPYVSRRTDDWIKLKCGRRQEFAIVGYTAPKGERLGFGALLLAVHDASGGLRYAGKVGTGFDHQLLQDLHKKLKAIEQEASPITVDRPPAGRDIQWVRPTLVCEVSFAEWTHGGHVRHATFKGLRTDKPATAITREDEVPANTLNKRASKQRTATAERGNARSSSSDDASRSVKGLKLTHADRVIDPSTGLTKLDLARYYGLVAPLMMEHLRKRPVSLLRETSGIGEPLFFQKHSDTAIPGVTMLPERLQPDHPPLMEIAKEVGILAAAQLNVVEFHTWNAVKTSIDKPDRLVFDLDPGKGVAWESMRQAAELLRVLLQELGLRAWLKTSGGKGLHVIVPIRKQYGWDTVKDFSATVVRHLASTLPQLFVAKSGPKNRVGKIYADYLRNGFGATTVSAWSARARPGLAVSVPVAWEELNGLQSSAQWTIANIHERLDAGNSPWEGYAPQGLAQAMKRIGFDPEQKS